MIPAPGAKELEALIVQLMSPDNAARGVAEATYNSWKQTPDVLLAAVMQVLVNSSYEEARSMCIVFLRSLIASSKESVWDNTNPATRQSVCSDLLVAVVNESNHVLRHKLDLLVAEIGAKLVQLGTQFFSLHLSHPLITRSHSRLSRALIPLLGTHS